MSNLSENKRCFVHECPNTSVQVPNKLFIAVPGNYSRKVNWFKAIGRDFPASKSKFYCCEDHFNLEEDMVNYMRYKLMGGKIFLKNDVLPHIFDCKEDKNKSAPKRQRKLSPTVIAPPVEEVIPKYMISKPIDDVKPYVKIIKYTAAPNTAALYKFRCKIEKKTEFTIVPGSARSKHIKFPMGKDSLSTIGLKKEFLFVIDLIKRHTYLSTDSIFLTLQKIRLSQTFSDLGEEYYVMSQYHTSDTFVRCVSIISERMRELITWHPKEKIQALLPAPFRGAYDKVQCILNCLEIKIEKPKDAVKQDLTWSDDKQANTLKYLVSSTPDGVVNFISTAFGGKTSDAVVVEKSGFLDHLQPEAVIMADRGFQNIENLLEQKQCTLLRPPYEKQEIVIYNRQVIGQLQEFKLLKPHPYVSSQLIPYMNSVTVIACGLINLQRSLN